MEVLPVTPSDYEIARERMVRDEVIAKGITDARVIDAMMRIPRHRFLGPDAGPEAYSNHAFPIGYAQTMSQPHTVAYLAENLMLAGKERVLEIGTGSGYTAAVLAALAARVYTVERIEALAIHAREALAHIGVCNIDITIGDGALGWEAKAPFDRILLTAAAQEVPESLLLQLRDGGFLLGPVTGAAGQEIVRLTRRGDRFELKRLKDCSFVPLIRDGDAADAPRPRP